MQNNDSLAMTSKKHENDETEDHESHEETYGKEKEAEYGCIGRYPEWLQCLNKIGCLTFFMTAFCCIYGFSINGALLTALSTMEKRFELSSTVSGVMLASYDIGFLITTIPLEALTRDMNRGRVLGCMSLIIGLASFLYSVPHFATSGKI